MTITKKTITCAVVAKQILAYWEERPFGCFFTGATPSGLKVHFKARQCTGQDTSRKQISGHSPFAEYLTGGVVLTAQVPSPGYGGLGAEYTTRLAPGWTVEALERAVARCERFGMREGSLNSHRTQIFNLAEKRKEFSWTGYDLAAEEHKVGLSIYADMNHADCHHWANWFGKFAKSDNARELVAQAEWS